MRPHMEMASWAWAEGKPNEFWSSSGTTSAETQYGRGAWTTSLARSFTMALTAKSRLSSSANERSRHQAMTAISPR